MELENQVMDQEVLVVVELEEQADPQQMVQLILVVEEVV